MSEWIFPTLSELLSREVPESSHPPSAALRQIKAEREWFSAIAALESLLSSTEGVLFSAPLPILSQPESFPNITTYSFTPNALFSGFSFQLPSANGETSECETNTLGLFPGDALAAEAFCLALTSKFSLLMVLGEDRAKNPAFFFSFDPEEITKAWQVLRLRVVLMNPGHLQKLDRLYATFPPIAPNYKLITQFSHALLSHLPDPIAESEKRTIRDPRPLQTPTADVLKSADVELLQAIAHEVRTPLTTIRTLTRLLLKRRDLPADAVKRLEMIDRECSEQIDRFGLIFRAVELETSATKVSSLATTSLEEVLEQSIPRWQKQANQRNLTLDVILPQHIPSVMSDPTMLDQALSSLIERSARSLPAGSSIQVEVSLAGHQLKLQLQAQKDDLPHDAHQMPLLKSLGQVLVFQPETGSLSLNLNVTKNIFQALGGKLIVRERPEQGEIYTLFLPLEPSKNASGMIV
ncbi:sensor histidine kinase [Leptolyngbya sp. GGD]|uniref:sensor histidine kinase n=1 Tax=Leptolyngbya sp. GGD TaxID=2997907 RepID=UPI00227A3DFB|nr:HAMP domain-containing sensor histidine kinase [Leptolyngbya sp. GGD]MCY6489517.1 HAMP domain-containing sensor histidine kinase [Leptolyngbya sp. GGD]